MPTIDETITDAEEAEVTKIFKGAMCTSPREDSLDLLDLGSSYFEWGTPFPFTSNNSTFIPNGGFMNLYQHTPSATELQQYKDSLYSRKLILIGTNERDTLGEDLTAAAADEAAIWHTQINTLYEVWSSPQIYVAGGSQLRAPNNPGSGSNLHFSVWIEKVWNNLNAADKSKIKGFHIHWYPDNDRYSTTTSHANPHPKWSRNSIAYRLKDWYDWFAASGDSYLANKKVILSETGSGVGNIPAGVNLPLRIHQACRDQSVKRWFWYGYYGDSSSTCAGYEHLTETQSGNTVLTNPVGMQFAAITPTTT